jgi:hypothetical protein
VDFATLNNLHVERDASDRNGSGPSSLILSIASKISGVAAALGTQWHAQTVLRLRKRLGQTSPSP